MNNSIESKEVNLCRAVAMLSDAETLLVRALKAYDREELTAFEQRVLDRGEGFLTAFQILCRKHNQTLDQLYELSGEEILDIGYE